MLAKDIIRIIKPLKTSGIMIDGVSETVKKEIKIQEGGFLLKVLYQNQWVGHKSSIHWWWHYNSW